jgi:hypothetical protein
MSVSTAFRLIGQASKRGISLQRSRRGIARKPPDGETLVADIRSWIESEYLDMVRSASSTHLESGEWQLLMDLYPTAAPVIIEADDAGHVAIEAETAGVGPGYQRFVGRLAERLAAEIGIEWTSSDGIAIVEGQIGVDRQTVERAHMAWLGSTLVGARDARRLRAGGMPIALPTDLRFEIGSAIATVLGPRDDAWLERSLTDVPTAIDILPWWADATDGRYHLNRALCLMWTQVRWRRPISPVERDIQDETLRILKRGAALDPRLPWPWREWHELLTIRGVSDAIATDVAGHAERLGPDELARQPIGYRRGQVLVVHEGWALPVPGSFGERTTPDEWVGNDAGRSITLAAVATGTARGPMSAEEFLAQVASDLGSDVIKRDEGGIKGRARITTDGSSGVEVGVLEGFAAVTGRGAAIRITFQDASDWQWALDLWRSLRPA